MWQKIFIIIVLFYLLTLMQISFFSQFSLFKSALNLVFIFFFLFAFLDNGHRFIFFAAVAGFFLDIFLYTYLGPSIILLIIIGFLLKKTQLFLINRGNNRPFIYFLPLFIVFFLIYNFLTGAYLYLAGFSNAVVIFDLRIIFSVIYNSFIASILFLAHKKLFKPADNDRQLALFK